MANINTNIRFYQPNDPYYYEVDNLPLTDLLDNDIALENRLIALENLIDNLGEGTASGVISFEAMKDLKAFTSSSIGEYGRVYVNPGRFISRMSLPATRESGWRMMGDESDDFNNQSEKLTTSLTTEASQSKMVARTSVVEFQPDIRGGAQYVSVPTFDRSDFTSDANPAERIDVVFVRAAVSMDRDGNVNTSTDLGLLKGAFFRLDGAGEQLNGTRFPDYPETNVGRMTGQSVGDIEEGTTLWGSIPLPEDLVNFEWKNNQASAGVMINGEEFAQKQIATRATFCLPVAYVRVGASFRQGGIIDQKNLIDIRPFLRSAELTYSERAALSRSNNPNGANPYITLSHLLFYTTDLDGKVSRLEGRVTVLEGQVNTLDVKLDALSDDVRGPTGLDHEGRIVSLEGLHAGGGTVLATETKCTGGQEVLRSAPFRWNGRTTHKWYLDDIPTNDRAKTCFAFIRFINWRAMGDGDVCMIDQIAITGASHPQSNYGGARILAGWKEDEMVASTTEAMVPVAYDANSDRVSVEFKTQGHDVYFDSGGGVRFSGIYVIKQPVI